MTDREISQTMAAIFRQAVVKYLPQERDRNVRITQFINAVQSAFVKLLGPLPPSR